MRIPWGAWRKFNEDQLSSQGKSKMKIEKDYESKYKPMKFQSNDENSKLRNTEISKSANGSAVSYKFKNVVIY